MKGEKKISRLSRAGKINSERPEMLICKNKERPQTANNLHVNRVNDFKSGDQIRSK